MGCGLVLPVRGFLLGEVFEVGFKVVVTGFGGTFGGLVEVDVGTGVDGSSVLVKDEVV